MTRILLADDSPHAQRMGERILREEGFEVVTVTDGQTAMMRLADVDPTWCSRMFPCPASPGYDICREMKPHPRHKHVRVILTAGLLEYFRRAQAAAVQCDGNAEEAVRSIAGDGDAKATGRGAQKDRDEYGPALQARHPTVVPVKVVTDTPNLRRT